MNIIDAVINLVNKPVTEVVSYYKGHNRANNAGEALEEYIKDLFANSFGLNEQARLQKMSEVFSYLGNNSNPPDAMLKKGDAIEIKKIETNTASLALNSSYPKQVLRSDSCGGFPFRSGDHGKRQTHHTAHQGESFSQRENAIRFCTHRHARHCTQILCGG